MLVSKEDKGLPKKKKVTLSCLIGCVSNFFFQIPSLGVERKAESVCTFESRKLLFLRNRQRKREIAREFHDPFFICVHRVRKFFLCVRDQLIWIPLIKVIHVA